MRDAREIRNMWKMTGIKMIERTKGKRKVVEKRGGDSERWSARREPSNQSVVIRKY